MFNLHKPYYIYGIYSCNMLYMPIFVPIFKEKRDDNQLNM